MLIPYTLEIAGHRFNLFESSKWSAIVFGTYSRKRVRAYKKQFGRRPTLNGPMDVCETYALMSETPRPVQLLHFYEEITKRRGNARWTRNHRWLVLIGNDRQPSAPTAEGAILSCPSAMLEGTV